MKDRPHDDNTVKYTLQEMTGDNLKDCAAKKLRDETDCAAKKNAVIKEDHVDKNNHDPPKRLARFRTRS